MTPEYVYRRERVFHNVGIEIPDDALHVDVTYHDHHAEVQFLEPIDADADDGGADQ